MEVELKNVHIGQAIQKRLEELKMSKSEFGRRIDVPQQHVNRIFERDTIETKKLVKICIALDFNFFSLFCEYPKNIKAYLSAVSTAGEAHNIIGDAAVVAEMEITKIKLEAAESRETSLRAQVATLENSIELYKQRVEDKDETIKILKSR